METQDLELRPVRPADRDRVAEICADIWEGHDYLPGVFDEWVADSAASFEAAEDVGVVVGLQRVRPISRDVVFYEGLRIASSHRRRGLARAMLRHAIAQARQQGFAEMRLVTGNPDARRLFESEGFRMLADCVPWVASRIEGGDPPRMASPPDAAKLFDRVSADPAMAAYGGVNLHWQAVLDLDAQLLERMAGEGLVRTNAGGRSLALVQPDPVQRLGVTFASGSGAALQDLLMGLRFEADSLGLEGVWLLAPADHPAATDLRAVGYDPGDDPFHIYAYGLRLQS